MRDTFEWDGCVWFRGALRDHDLVPFERVCSIGSRPGGRLDLGRNFQFLQDPDHPLMQCLRSLQPETFAVRAVAFNKSEVRNWGLPWHQDRVIAVREKAVAEGYENWSLKAGQWHCEPPETVLDRMLFVRVHLDDCDGDNGAMEIARGSHRRGTVVAAQAENVAAAFPIDICQAVRGDVLVLHMLTLHRSLPATDIRPRRVVRMDFTDQDLPAPLHWAN